MIPNTETMYPFIRPEYTGAQQSTVDRPDDIAALEAAQEGYQAYREVPWNDMSRGMAKSPDEEQLHTDEGHLRVFWRKWSELMERRG